MKNIKRFLVILSIALVGLTLFVGCSKDDNNKDLPDRIVGKWKTIAVNQTQNGKPVETTDDITGSGFEFNANLSYTITYQNVTVETGTYKINGSTINMTVTDTNYNSIGTFNFSSDGKLHIYVQRPDGITTREIVLLKIN